MLSIAKISEDTTVPLLESSDGIEPICLRLTNTSTLRKRFISNATHILTIVLLLYLCIVVTVKLSISTISHNSSAPSIFVDVPSLTDGYLTYERQSAWKELAAPWNRPPSPELDDAWDDLLTAQNIRVTEEEMHIEGENTTHRVRLLDGGYVGILGVWHHLHCLDHLRRMIHFDYYGKHATQNSLPLYKKEHSDHCIESLRRAIICRADTALYSAEWIKDSHEPENKAIRSNAETVCVNWDSIDKWARSRALTASNMKYLAGPFEKPHGNRL